MRLERRSNRDFDKGLLIMVLAVLAFGIFVLYSATRSRGLPLTESLVMRQASWLVLGLILMGVTVSISYQKFIDAAYLLYGVTVILLIVVLVIGKARLGAQRWFSIGGFAFQPSEFIKLCLILVLARYGGSHKGALGEVRSLIMPVIFMALPFVLVLIQPDLGTALLLVPVFFAVLLVGGARPKHLGAMIVAGLATLPAFWHILRGYQKQRLLVFLNPNVDPLGAGYTIIQSKIAIGSGGLFGKGWLGGTQSQLNFLPERHTDFIFSVIGEEWGFLGSLALLLAYFFIIKRAITIAEQTSDTYGKLIASGIAVMLSFQVAINIGMTVGLMPVVGVPLPLVSYGGSSLVATLIAVGLLLNVAMRRSRF